MIYTPKNYKNGFKLLRITCPHYLLPGDPGLSVALRIVSNKHLKRLVRRFRSLTRSDDVLSKRNNVKQPTEAVTQRQKWGLIGTPLTCYIGYTIQKLDRQRVGASFHEADSSGILLGDPKPVYETPWVSKITQKANYRRCGCCWLTLDTYRNTPDSLPP